MLTIRLQRRGRKGHAQFRVVVQDSRFTPTSGRVVKNLGPYNPHTKTAVLDKESAEEYLKNGAQPSNRVAKLLKDEGVKLPKWVKIDDSKAAKLKNPDKLRKNQPAEETAPEAAADDQVAAEDTSDDKQGEEEKAPETTEEPVAESEGASEDEPKEEPKADEADEPAEEANEEDEKEEKSDE